MGQRNAVTSAFAACGAPPASVWAACGVAPASAWAEDGGPGAPHIHDILPSSGEQNTVVNVTIRGENFVAGSTVQVSGAGIVVSAVVVVDASTITCTLTIDIAATATVRNLTVTTP